MSTMANFIQYTLITKILILHNGIHFLFYYSISAYQVNLRATQLQKGHLGVSRILNAIVL